MADPGAENSALNPSERTLRSTSAARREREKKRDATKVYLRDVYNKWREFKEENHFDTDQDVAEFLLDYYAARNTRYEVETFDLLMVTSCFLSLICSAIFLAMRELRQKIY